MYIKILFYSAPRFRSENETLFDDITFLGNSNFTFQDIKKYYKVVHAYTESKVYLDKNELFEKLFNLFNSPENPLCKQQKLIKTNKLHTSMSIGDIIEVDEKERYMVGGLGFRKLKNN
jgi:hypothetical protein